jgi:hypothetical protein
MLRLFESFDAATQKLCASKEKKCGTSARSLDTLHSGVSCGLRLDAVRHTALDLCAARWVQRESLRTCRSLDKFGNSPWTTQIDACVRACVLMASTLTNGTYTCHVQVARKMGVAFRGG